MQGLTCFTILSLVAFCACADLPDCGPGSPLHHPHPTDCGKYYTCDNGVAVEQSCAPGLWWNVDIEGCDLPEHTECAASTSTVGTTPSTTGTTPGTTQTTPTTPAATTAGPMCGPGSPSHIPHPTDCSKYYTCDEGVAILQECPPGLWWNVAIEGCDFPENTICGASTTQGPTTTTGTSTPPIETTTGGESTPPIETTTGGESTPPTEPPSTTDGNTDLPDCKGESDTLFGHPTDCTKFYKCLEGVPILMSCPPGQWWSQEHLWCDYPDQSGCVPGGSTSGTNPPTEATMAA